MDEIRKFRRTVFVALFLLYFSRQGAGQDTAVPPPVSQTPLQLKGVVTKVELAFGSGPGSVLLKTKGNQEWTIRLGPPRFLLQRGFNLAVGDEVEVRGIPANKENSSVIVALEVMNRQTGKTITLRDERMRPLWRCCRGTRYLE